MSTKTTKAPKKQVKKSSHPPFSKVVLAVMLKHGTPKGISLQLISKHIKEGYPVHDNYLQYTKAAMKRLMAEGKLKKVTGIGMSGSFKLDKSLTEKEGKKKKKAPSAKKPAPATPVAAKKPVAAVKKPATPKKTPPKKTKKPVAKPKDAPKNKPAKPVARAKKAAVNKPKRPKTPKKAPTKKK